MHGDYYYVYNMEELKKVAEKEKWICKYDDFKSEETEDEKAERKMKEKEQQVVKINELEKLLKEANEKISELTKNTDKIIIKPKEKAPIISMFNNKSSEGVEIPDTDSDSDIDYEAEGLI